MLFPLQDQMRDSTLSPVMELLSMPSFPPTTWLSKLEKPLVFTLEVFCK